MMSRQFIVFTLLVASSTLVSATPSNDSTILREHIIDLCQSINLIESSEAQQVCLVVADLLVIVAVDLGFDSLTNIDHANRNDVFGCLGCVSVIEGVKYLALQEGFQRALHNQAVKFCNYINFNLDLGFNCKTLVDPWIDEISSYLQRIEPSQHCNSMELCGKTVQLGKSKDRVGGEPRQLGEELMLQPFGGVGARLDNLLNKFINIFSPSFKLKPAIAGYKSGKKSSTPDNSVQDKECERFEFHFWESLHFVDYNTTVSPKRMPSKERIEELCVDCKFRVQNLQTLVRKPLVAPRCGSKVAEMFCAKYDAAEIDNCQLIMVQKVELVVKYIKSSEPYKYCAALNFCPK